MGNLRQEKKGNRILFFDLDEDGLHVATIVEQAKPRRDGKRLIEGCYQWLTAHNGGHCGFFEDAEDEVNTELDR